MEVLTEALEILKNEANEAGLPFVFSDAAIQQRFNCFNNDLPANDDNVPFLTTLEELDEELSENSEAKAWFPEFRQPKDWDAVASIETIKRWSDACSDQIISLIPGSERKLKCKMVDGTAIEFELIGEPSTQILCDLAQNFWETDFPGGTIALAATPMVLYLTKRSHIQWAIHWQKNIRDLHWLKARSLDWLKARNLEPSETEMAYYAARLSEHKTRFKDRTAKLAMTNEAFFAKSAKAVGRVIEHDRLHEIVAYGDRPLFEKFKTDLSLAILDKNLFNQASLIDQLRLVREETMVIALERYIIPALPNIIDIEGAYGKALQRICTTLTSGWFRDFAIDHWSEIQKPDKDFVSEVIRFFEVHR
ncbi:unnamed protein product [Sphagnum tenellum]